MCFVNEFWDNMPQHRKCERVNRIIYSRVSEHFFKIFIRFYKKKSIGKFLKIDKFIKYTNN